MLITTDFWVAGVPQTGLTPSITVYDVDEINIVVNAQTMTEVAMGAYKYEFSGYSDTKNYYIVCDGGATLDTSVRYNHSFNESVTLARPIGTVADDAANTITAFKTNLTSSEADYLKGSFIRFVTGANSNQVKKVLAYNATTHFVTISIGFTDIPAAGDIFKIINE